VQIPIAVIQSLIVKRYQNNLKKKTTKISFQLNLGIKKKIENFRIYFISPINLIVGFFLLAALKNNQKLERER
jgi:hypothetical protein